MRKPKYAVLLYRRAFAEVLTVKCLNMSPFGRNAKRLYQGSKRTARAFAEGMGACGVVVRTARCSDAGDAALVKWQDGELQLTSSDSGSTDTRYENHESREPIRRAR